MVPRLEPGNPYLETLPRCRIYQLTSRLEPGKPISRGSASLPKMEAEPRDLRYQAPAW